MSWYTKITNRKTRVVTGWLLMRIKKKTLKTQQVKLCKWLQRFLDALWVWQKHLCLCTAEEWCDMKIRYQDIWLLILEVLGKQPIDREEPALRRWIWRLLQKIRREMVVAHAKIVAPNNRKLFRRGCFWRWSCLSLQKKKREKPWTRRKESMGNEKLILEGK